MKIYKKIIKIFIFAFLCNEMHTNINSTKSSVTTAKYPLNYYYNGTVASHANAKHHASVRLKVRDQNFGEGHICSGVVIAPSVVLTAGQCIHNYRTNKQRHPSEFKIVLGTLNRYQRSATTLIYDVTHVYQPYTFDPQLLHNNIAILMLNRDIPDGLVAVQRINLNDNDNENINEKYTDDSIYQLTSWAGNSATLPIKQLVSLKATKLNDQTCLESYGGIFSLQNTFCMAVSNDDNNADLCLTDAGAPLIYNNHLYALSSYGSGCVGRSGPVVYTAIAPYKEWILTKIGNGTNQNSSLWGALAFLLFTIFAFKTLPK